MSKLLPLTLFNRPLLISDRFAEALMGAMASGSLASLALPARENRALSATEVRDGIAIIGVYDYLSYRADEMAAFFIGNTTYDGIRSQFQSAMADPTIKAIVLDINSPGGEVSGCFDLIDEIYEARGTKPIYAVINEDAMSAAFGIASAADRRYVARTGAAGSVGVVAMHLDQSGYDAQRGLVYTPIYAGKHKVDFSSHSPMTPEALAMAQADVDATYDIFVSTVARNLGMTPAAVRATEARIYQGKKAVEAGFADSVSSMGSFMAKLSGRKYGGIMKAELEKLFAQMMAIISGKGDEPITKAAADTLVATARAEGLAEGLAQGKTAGLAEGKALGKAEGITEGLTTGAVEGAKAQRTLSGEIVDRCLAANVDMTFAKTLLVDEAMTVEAAGTKILEKKADTSGRTAINSSTSPLTTGDKNPLIADAEARAGKKE